MVDGTVKAMLTVKWSPDRPRASHLGDCLIDSGVVLDEFDVNANKRLSKVDVCSLNGKALPLLENERIK